MSSWAVISDHRVGIKNSNEYDNFSDRLVRLHGEKECQTIDLTATWDDDINRGRGLGREKGREIPVTALLAQ